MAAAGAKLRRSLRLTEVVRHKVGRPGPTGAQGTPAPRPLRPATGRVAAASGLVLIGTSTGGPPALEAVLTEEHVADPDEPMRLDDISRRLPFERHKTVRRA